VQPSNLDNDGCELTITNKAKLACIKAYGGSPFHIFSTSTDVSKCYFFNDVPKSPETIKKWYWINTVL
jgi:hypothetical protein